MQFRQPGGVGAPGFQQLVHVGSPVGALRDVGEGSSSFRLAMKSCRSAVADAIRGSRPASRTVSATSRISSARRFPCNAVRMIMYDAIFSQSSSGKVSCSDASTRSSTP